MASIFIEQVAIISAAMLAVAVATQEQLEEVFPASLTVILTSAPTVLAAPVGIS